MDIPNIQKKMAADHLDGWLLYDFRRTNDLACQFLVIPQDQLLTRRFFYWIPTKGDPVKIVHAIEDTALSHLPGRVMKYRSWQELEKALEEVLKNSKKIAMEYSPRNAIPYVSKVDAGTMDVVRGFGMDVVSSANLLQAYTSVWSPQQLESHLIAAEVLSNTFDKAWDLISRNLGKITEYDVQQFILQEFANQQCITDDPPICAINANSANPHYAPKKEGSALIKANDFILIDLWCKQKKIDAVYADITRVGVAAKAPTQKQQQVFNIVKQARDAGTDLVLQRFQKGRPIKGYEVDAACRQVIENEGFGEFFIHRTGHSIGIQDHGAGANIDSLETQDERFLLPGTCFSIEPGIYLSDNFGVRLEYDLYIHLDGRIQITGGIQESLNTIPI